MATVYEFNYTGSEQSVTLKPGKYELECWGACGGKYSTNIWSDCAKGGYAKGEVTLKKETVLHICVGQTGFEITSSSSPLKRTGYNGAGLGSSMGSGGTKWSTVGGGATDIRLVGGAWNDSQGLLSRIIVAGGAGGCNDDTPYIGGNGGGYAGERGTVYYSFTTGGTQYQGGLSYDERYNGSFGRGGSGASVGGGGGWYGGGGSTSDGAGGGSGYALTKDSYKPTGYIPTSEYWLENVVMKSGGNTTKADGYAKITLLQALPFLTVSSYNSTTAKFKADHTDPTLLNKIEWFIDDELKETITTDLTAEKTINYRLEDNALHTLKIVVTDNTNATSEKVVNVSKNIMPLEDDANLKDITSKIKEMKDGLKTGKTSIINTLALKNINADLNNTLVDLSEKIKNSFNSSDASLKELQNKITELTNQLSQRKKWAKGTYASNPGLHIEANTAIGTSKTIEINVGLNFNPSIIIIDSISMLDDRKRVYFTNVSNLSNVNIGRYLDTGDFWRTNGNITLQISGRNFKLTVSKEKGLNGSADELISTADGFTWYAFE